MTNTSMNQNTPFDKIIDENAASKKGSATLNLCANGYGGCPLAPGKYEVEISNMGVHPHPKNYDMVRLDFEVLTGANAGYRGTKWYHLATPKARDFLKKEFAKLGAQVTDRMSLLDSAAIVVGKQAIIDVVLNGGSPSFYVQNVVNPAPRVSLPDDIWNI